MTREEYLKSKIALTEQTIDLYKNELRLYKNELSEIQGRAQLELKSAPPVIEIPLIGGSTYPVYAEEINDWAKAYPTIDLRVELEKMKQWCISHPKQQKTRRGCRRFITGWLSRQQNKPAFDFKKVKVIDQRPLIFGAS